MHSWRTKPTVNRCVVVLKLKQWNKLFNGRQGQKSTASTHLTSSFPKSCDISGSSIQKMPDRKAGRRCWTQESGHRLCNRAVSDCRDSGARCYHVVRARAATRLGGTGGRARAAGTASLYGRTGARRVAVAASGDGCWCGSIADGRSGKCWARLRVAGAGAGSGSGPAPRVGSPIHHDVGMTRQAVAILIAHSIFVIPISQVQFQTSLYVVTCLDEVLESKIKLIYTLQTSCVMVTSLFGKRCLCSIEAR